MMQPRRRAAAALACVLLAHLLTACAPAPAVPTEGAFTLTEVQGPATVSGAESDPPAATAGPTPTPIPAPEETPISEETPAPAETSAPEATPIPTPTPAPTPAPTRRPVAGYSEERYNRVVKQILDQIITDGMTPREQCRAVYDYVQRHVLTAYVITTERSDWKRGAYSGFTKRVGDCYTTYSCSRALLTALGIENMEVQRWGSDMTSTHYWNLVNDGEGWYHFDALHRVENLGFECFMATDQECYDYCQANGRQYYYFDSAAYPARVGGRLDFQTGLMIEDEPAPEETPTPEETVEPAAEPTEEPAPTEGPAPEETAEPTAEPMDESAPEETPIPEETPAPEETAEPTATPTAEPTEEPVPTETLPPESTPTPEDDGEREGL